MTIESSPPAQTPHASAHGPGARARSSAPEGAGSGFMAMLGALADAGSSDAAGDTGTGNLASASTLPDAAVAAAAPALPFDATALLQQNAQFLAGPSSTDGQDSTALLTDAGLARVATAADALGTGAAAPLVPASDAAALPNAAALAALLQPVAPPAPAAGPVATEVPATPATPALRGVPSASRPGERQATALGAPGTAAEPATATPSSWQQAAAHARSSKDALPAPDANTAAANAAPAQPSAADAGKLAAALEQVRSQAARAPEPVVLAPALLRTEKAQGERSNASERSREPSYSGLALGVSSPDYSASAATTPVLAPDMAAAEQVSYWVSHNLQNAELTLDGLGQAPVEVSIRLQGHEAQIAFRSDEAATRSVLESAGTHLKELLQREGLVLTGVSVGQSGSGTANPGGSDGEQRRARQGMRQGLVAPVTLSTAAAPRRQGGVAGRSLDLFV